MKLVSVESDTIPYSSSVVSVVNDQSKMRESFKSKGIFTASMIDNREPFVNLKIDLYRLDRGRGSSVAKGFVFLGAYQSDF